MEENERRARPPTLLDITGILNITVKMTAAMQAINYGDHEEARKRILEVLDLQAAFLEKLQDD